MKTITIKGDGVVSVVLTLVIGAVFGAYILGTLYPVVTADTLPSSTTQATGDIVEKGMTSLTVVALAGMVVVIGFIMKSI